MNISLPTWAAIGFLTLTALALGLMHINATAG